MGALPKRKISRGRRGNRRSHWKATAPRLVKCPGCGEPVLPHHICLSCGEYRGVKIVEIKKKEK